jgi:hypothetical protein
MKLVIKSLLSLSICLIAGSAFADTIYTPPQTITCTAGSSGGVTCSENYDTHLFKIDISPNITPGTYKLMFALGNTNPSSPFLYYMYAANCNAPISMKLYSNPANSSVAVPALGYGQWQEAKGAGGCAALGDASLCPYTTSDTH